MRIVVKKKLCKICHLMKSLDKFRGCRRRCTKCDKEYLNKNRKKINARRRANKAKDPEKYNAVQRAYYAKNREKLCAQKNAKRAADPEKRRSADHARLAQKPGVI